MKPKRLKTKPERGPHKRDPHPMVGKSPVGVTWDTYLRIILEEYLREQFLLQKRSFPHGDLEGWLSKRSATFRSFGPKSPNGRTKQRAARRKRVRGSDRYPISYGEKGKGGVMTDNAKNVIGRRTITTVSTSGSPPASSSSTIVQAPIAYQKIVQFVSSVKGDHKRPNPHSYQALKIDQGSGFTYAGDYRNNTQISGTQAVGFGFGGVTFTDRGNAAYNAAVSRMYDKIRGDVDLSVDVFQARQTGVMLNRRFAQARHVFTMAAPKALWAIGGIVSIFKRSNPRDWGNLWLEWIYGWKPFADDLYGSMENMILSSKKGSGISGHPIKVTATEIGDERVIKSFDAVNGTELDKLIFSKYQSRIVAFYALTTGGLNSVANYTSLNPVKIAWEVIPYSFVVDWFINIGGYLRNLESGLLYASDFSYGYRSQRYTKSEVHQVAGGNASYSAVAAGSSLTRGFNRFVLTGAPLPRAPSFNPKLGPTRLISAASLLGQQLHSLKHRKEAYERKFPDDTKYVNWNSFHHS